MGTLILFLTNISAAGTFACATPGRKPTLPSGPRHPLRQRLLRYRARHPRVPSTLSTKAVVGAWPLGERCTLENPVQGEAARVKDGVGDNVGNACG